MILEDQIDIQASKERVWQVTIDVESWPLWSPAMETIVRQDSGEFKVGSSALVKQKLIPETRWEVVELSPGHGFAWKTEVWGMKMQATHLLVPGDSAVTSVLKIDIKGGVAKVLWPLLKPQVLRALKEENRGLKKYCESKS